MLEVQYTGYDIIIYDLFNSVNAIFGIKYTTAGITTVSRIEMRLSNITS